MNDHRAEFKENLRRGVATLRAESWSRKLAEMQQPVWLVGGAVRDLALGLPVKDIDLALPCGRSLPVGRELATSLAASFVPLHEVFGVCRVVLADGRRLDLADLQAETIEDDLRRRDLTINALALPWPAGEPVADVVGGLPDLAAGLARRAAPGVLHDDPLRILRVVRFAAQLSLTIDNDTAEECRAAARLLDRIPGERIWEELKQILGGGVAARWIDTLDAFGALDALFPALAEGAEFEQPGYHHLDVRAHAVEAARLVDPLPDDPAFAAALVDPEDRVLLRLAALFHDLGKPSTAHTDPNKGYTRFPGHSSRGAVMIDDIAARLRLSRRERFRLKRLVENHMRPHQLAELLATSHLTNKAIRRFFLDLEGDWLLCLALARADLCATRGPAAPCDGEARSAALVEQLQREKAKRPAATRMPPVTGADILALGVPAGPAVGELLDEIDEALFADPSLTREAALALLGKAAEKKGYRLTSPREK